MSKTALNSIEILIGNQRFVLKSEESLDHLREVTEMVKRKVEAVKKKAPTQTFQKAAMLAAFDLASDLIKAKKKSVEYRSSVMNKAQQVLSKIELELDAR